MYPSIVQSIALMLILCANVPPTSPTAAGGAMQCYGLILTSDFSQSSAVKDYLLESLLISDMQGMRKSFKTSFYRLVDMTSLTDSFMPPLAS